MKMILFYILRRFFVKLRIESEFIVLEKTLIISVKTVVNRAKIVRIQTRITPIMRVFHAKEVKIFTERGKISFYLGENEPFEILPKRGKTVIKPRFREVLFGAFIDAKALAGITFFAITLSKIGKILGENYLDSIIRVLFTTAENVTEALAFANIIIPKAAVFIGIAAISAWFFGFLHKLIMYCRFELKSSSGAIVVRNGIITLYENVLVQNSAIVSRETLFSLITRRKTLYCRKVLIIPCTGPRQSKRLLRVLFSLKIPKKSPIKSPRRAFFGHCSLPLWLFAISSLLLIIIIIFGSETALLLRTITAAGVFLSAYLILLNFVYFMHKKHVFSQNLTAISCNKAAALYTVFLPRSFSASSTLSQSPLDTSLCTLTLTLPDRSKYQAKLIPLADLARGLAGQLSYPA